MKQNANITIQLQRFADERACLEFLLAHHWGGKSLCPDCRTSKGRLHATRRVWTCACCGGQYSVVKGTAFEGSKKPLTTWFLAIHLFLNSNGSLTASELQFLADLGSYQTALVWMRKLRQGAARLFEAEARVPEGMAAQIRMAMPEKVAAKSCTPLIREFLDQLRVLCPVQIQSSVRWRVSLAAWSSSLAHRRGRASSFPERVGELGFHLMWQPRHQLSHLLGALAPWSPENAGAPLDIRLNFANIQAEQS